MSVLVVASKIKALAKKKGLRTSAEAIEALSEVVESVINSAVKKAKEEGVATIKERHIGVEVEND